MNNDRLIKFCQKLIQAKSISGQEKQVAELIINEMNSLGYDEAYIDDYGNAIGIIKGTDNKSVLLDGHMDTVEVTNPNEWSVEPFGGIIKEGKIFGRGTSDMKCALASMIYGAARLKDKKLNGNIYVAGVVYEEIFEGIALGKILDRIKPNYVIIGEASRLTLKIGQRGRAEIAIKTFGKNAHSANPEKGVNAINKMIKLLEEIKYIELPSDLELGNAILELTDIVSSPYPGASVVPDKCRVTFDRRLLTGETEETVLAPINNCIDKIKSIDPYFNTCAEYVTAVANTYTGNKISGKRFFPAWKTNENSEIVQKSISALTSLGLEPEINYYSFCTDGSESAGKRGIPTIGIGPSFEHLAHTVDEYIEISEILKAEKVYEKIIESLLC